MVLYTIINEYDVLQAHEIELPFVATMMQENGKTNCQQDFTIPSSDLNRYKGVTSLNGVIC